MIRLEDILKMSWRRFSRRLEDVLKTSSKRLEDVLKMSWRPFCKTSWRRLGNVLKTSWRRLENVLKTSWRRLEDVWPRRIYWSWPSCLEDVLKTPSEDIRLRRTNSSWSRRLQDAIWRQRRKTSSRRFQDVFSKTNVCWGCV